MSKGRSTEYVRPSKGAAKLGQSDTKPVDTTNRAFNLTDVNVEIKKPNITHWLLKDVPREFMVDAANTWDAHPFNV